MVAVCIIGLDLANPWLASAATGDGGFLTSHQGGAPTEFPATLGLHLAADWHLRFSLVCSKKRQLED